MTIDVVLPRLDLAIVVLRPSLVERVFLRAREQERFARRVRTSGGEHVWIWDVGGGWVGRRVELEIWDVGGGWVGRRVELEIEQAERELAAAAAEAAARLCSGAMYAGTPTS